MSKKNHMVPVRETWIEQRGGLLLSIFFHLVLFSFLITRYPEFMIPKDMKNPLTLLLNLSYEPAENEAPSFNPAVSTFQDENAAEEAPPEPANEVTEEPVEKVAFPKERPLPEYKTGIEEMEKDLENSMSDLRKAIERRSLNVNAEKAMERSSLNNKGTRAGYDSSGADEGTVREFDIGNVPEKISDRVLQKYRIRITKKFISGENNVSFLNRVQVQGKTFFSGNASGYYEVFEIPMEAVKKMTFLENMELYERKLDPSKTRVKRIVFGIVQNNGDYDLGITSFEYEVIN
jgi:hypothetical protein